MRVHKVYWLNTTTEKLELSAVFRLKEDGELDVEWVDNRFKPIAEQGIATGKGVFSMRDGKGFFENIELAFSRSTLIHVERETSE